MDRAAKQFSRRIPTAIINEVVQGTFLTVRRKRQLNGIDGYFSDGISRCTFIRGIFLFDILSEVFKTDMNGGREEVMESQI